MKTLVVCFFVLISINILGQNRNTKGFTKPHLTLENCPEKDCIEKSIIEIIKSVITIDDLGGKERFFSMYFVVDDKGDVIPESIQIGNNRTPKTTALKNKILELPKFSPVRNEHDFPVLDLYSFNAKVSDAHGTLMVSPYTNEDKFLAEVQQRDNIKVPIYKGCDDYEGNNALLKKCFSSKVTTTFVKKFNYDKAISNINVKGSIRTYLFFAVNEEGKLDNIKCFAHTSKIKKEALRILNKHPKSKAGIRDGKNARFFYKLPLTLKI